MPRRVLNLLRVDLRIYNPGAEDIRETNFLYRAEQLLRRLKPEQEELNIAFRYTVTPQFRTLVDDMLIRSLPIPDCYIQNYITEEKRFASESFWERVYDVKDVREEFNRMMAMTDSEHDREIELVIEQQRNFKRLIEEDRRSEDRKPEDPKPEALVKQPVAISIYELSNGREGGFGQDSFAHREDLRQRHSEYIGFYKF